MLTSKGKRLASDMNQSLEKGFGKANISFVKGGTNRNCIPFEKFPVAGHLDGQDFTNLQTPWEYMCTGLEDLCMGIDVIHSLMVHIYLGFLNCVISLHKQHYTELMSTEVFFIA